MLTIPDRGVLERAVERVRGAARALKVGDELARRRRLASAIPRGTEIDHLLDERAGYGLVTPELIPEIAAAVEFAQKVRDEKREPAKKKRDYNPTILDAKHYEDAPVFFDLALCDQVLQIAAEYLGEVPILYNLKLWHTSAEPAEMLKGSQLYHRDGRRWFLRRVKFLINMSDVDADCGPFTFLPADVSNRVSRALGSMKNQDHINDEIVYRHTDPSKAVAMTGPAGTGAAINSSRCFHYGARVRRRDRLMLQFQFLRIADAVEGGDIRRSAGFTERFGDDAIRNLVMPQ